MVFLKFVIIVIKDTLINGKKPDDLHVLDSELELVDLSSS